MEKQSNDGFHKNSGRLTELEKTCFVIMPFGKKEVAGKEVDFDNIYKNIFEPAINTVTTPENESLIAKRTDMDAFSGSINQEMFEYIMYSRMAFADISGFNPNVFYEIGARHSAQESGTVVFRQTGHAIPFDITSIKVFEYEHEPDSKIKTSRKFITQVISESLRQNRLDSPVRLALRAQWSGVPTHMPELAGSPESHIHHPDSDQESYSPPNKDYWKKQVIERFMRDAEEAIRLGDHDMARSNYWAALRLDPLNIIARMRLALILKNQGNLYDALQEFVTITRLQPDYGEAWKEKGVIEGLLARKLKDNERKKTKWLPDGYDSLKKATLLIPNDFDAWSSLGGVLKNVHGDFDSAHKMYKHASEISDGHPYPLLNALKLEALETGKLSLKPISSLLKKAKKLRVAQSEASPPVDTPWCYFDIAEISLYQNDKEGFLDFLKEGLDSCSEKWQPETLLNSLKDTLVEKNIKLDGLQEGLNLISEAIASYE